MLPLETNNTQKNEKLEIRFYYVSSYTHYENTPIQIYRKFHLKKTENFQIKNSYIFHISAQNIDCGYPRRGGSNGYPMF